MVRYKVVIEYLGTNFRGWQKQKNVSTVQETIENAAAKILQEKVNLTVAGRTDAGVHAEGQVAHLDCSKKICSSKILLGINFYLRNEKYGEDISIKKVEKVNEEFNARFSALNKTYKYKIFNKHFSSPLNQKNSWWVKQKLNVKDMMQASNFLLGKHDFTSFRAVGCQAKSPIKTLSKISITKKKNIITISFTARSFLYNQVRIMSGTLKDVGTGLVKPKELKNIISAKNRSGAGSTAPAKGLTLLKVNYK